MRNPPNWSKEKVIDDEWYKEGCTDRRNENGHDVSPGQAAPPWARFLVIDFLKQRS